ncbi:T3SS effector NleG family protein [Escherichia albertii]|uniref:T3SS effector NleG family protein n=1 Tax=Escherichia albertii TaxID=208962 RepID=UPI00133146E0|nr:T3SS effector protein NleG8 [Escherichia albertii]
MPIILNISGGRSLPENELEALRGIVRSNQTETFIVGNRRLTARHIPLVSSFSVEARPGSLFERLGDGRYRRLADSLERQLNGGSTFLQNVTTYMAQARSAPSVPVRTGDTVQGRINSYAFPVNPGDFPRDEQHLSCPITLCVPATGLFVRNAQGSDVCSLYDREVVIEMLRRNDPHPLSREPFTLDMIVSRDGCCFDTEEQRFCVKSEQNTRL